MPPQNMIQKEFLKAVLTGEKALLKMNAVRFINVPAFDEISIKALYDQALEMEGMSKYFPSKYAKSRQADKTYFYNVWNTLYPEEVKEVINFANRQRFTITEEKARDESIIITEDWKKEIAEYPFISKKKGRMSALLKQKSKILKIKKPRKTFPAFDFR